MTVTLVLAGAGIRGGDYARHAVRDGRARLVAVAEPDEARRAASPPSTASRRTASSTDWRDLAERPRLADAVIVATQDAMHVDPARRLRRPRLPRAAREADGADRGRSPRRSPRPPSGPESCSPSATSCATPPTPARSRTCSTPGGSATSISVQHLEPIGWWHFAHSYVRGNWRSEARSSPMLLAKCCHDLDWLGHLIGRPARPGVLLRRPHALPAGEPPGRGRRPLPRLRGRAGLPVLRAAALPGLVGDPVRRHWPLSALTSDPTRDGVLEALRDGPYGRCVYACDNDVADQQVVTIEYEGGVTASLTATAFTPRAFAPDPDLRHHGAASRATVTA